MAAVRVHVVSVGFFNVDADTGVKIDKSSTSTTLNQMRNTASQHLVIPDAAIPSSAGDPTVKEYLEAEALLGYVLAHMDQTTIVTYER